MEYLATFLKLTQGKISRRRTKMSSLRKLIDDHCDSEGFCHPGATMSPHFSKWARVLSSILAINDK